MKKFTKIALVVASFVLVAALSVGGTLAWLSAHTDPVTNTFSPSDIGLVLEEHKYDPETNELLTDIVYNNDNYHMIPALELPKDPYIKVDAKSEDCYVFVEVVIENNVVKNSDPEKKYLQYTISTDWEQLPGVTGPNDGDVYTYVGSWANEKGIVEYSDDPVGPMYIITGNEVVVNPEITDEEMDLIEEGKEPKMVFYGYAIQELNMADAAEAWTFMEGELPE